MGEITVIFPSVLTSATGGEKEVKVSASSLKDALNLLASRYGEKFKGRIFDSSGGVRRLLNFYVNGKNIQHLGGIDVHLEDGDEVSIIPAVAGG